MTDPCGGNVPGGDGCRCDPPFARPRTATVDWSGFGPVSELPAAPVLPRIGPGWLVEFSRPADGGVFMRGILAAGDGSDGSPLRLIEDPFVGDGPEG